MNIEMRKEPPSDYKKKETGTCGSYIMKQLEDVISRENETVYLDASLPACWSMK